MTMRINLLALAPSNNYEHWLDFYNVETEEEVAATLRSSYCGTTIDVDVICQTKLDDDEQTISELQNQINSRWEVEIPFGWLKELFTEKQ